MSTIGDREAVVPRDKPPHPYSPVVDSMFEYQLNESSQRE
jgi:hypothetical protein